jgi:hypothetical protein
MSFTASNIRGLALLDELAMNARRKPFPLPHPAPSRVEGRAFRRVIALFLPRVEASAVRASLGLKCFAARDYGSRSPAGRQPAASWPPHHDFVQKVQKMNHLPGVA